MKRRVLAVLLVLGLCVGTASGQFGFGGIVHDPTNYANAVRREYIPENPARAVKHFNELRERPVKQMLTLEQENRILSAASPHFRVGIVLLVQTGGRTYTEGFQLRWDQIDWEN